jgi:hypothetical protein
MLALLHSTAFSQNQNFGQGTVTAGSFTTYGPTGRYFFANRDDATGASGYYWSATNAGAFLSHSQTGSLLNVTSGGKLTLLGPAANTKLSLFGDNNQAYGLGYQTNQFRLHLGGTASRFSFLDAPNGKELFTIHSTGAIGVGTGTAPIPAGFLMAVKGKMITEAIGIGMETIPAGYLMAVKGKVVTDGIGVGTGTQSIPAGFLMAVKGKMITEGVQVGLALNWPDYVFQPAYRLKPLSELETFIRTRGHLPNIPSAQEVEQQGGILLGEMNARLLEKVEELTLYLIEEQKAREKLAAEVKTLQQKLKK